MTGIYLARSGLAGILRQKQWTVADLLRRIDEMGFSLDKKTVYRLTKSEPIRTLNLPVVAAVSHALELSDPGELIEWSDAAASPARLQRIDEATQARLDELMDRNTEGTLKAGERREFEKLGEMVEKLSLENASLLAQQTRLNEDAGVRLTRLNEDAGVRLTRLNEHAGAPPTRLNEDAGARPYRAGAKASPPVRKRKNTKP